MRYGTEDSFINSIVGEGTHFRGHLEPAGLLRIDGDFTGSIRSDGKVLIGKHGRADCTIEAGTVVIGGVIRGSINATEKVIVLSTGMILGNIYTPRLIAEEGVLMDGEFSVRGSVPLPQPLSLRSRTQSGEPYWLPDPQPQQVHSAVGSSLRLSVSPRA
jgi:cytoskeletal protein CcmA (bactofilin family)